jgi:hypothetical protein
MERNGGVSFLETIEEHELALLDSLGNHYQRMQAIA